MTKEQLDAAHTTVIRKHYRKLEDRPGRVHAELLDDLAAIANQHAEDLMENGNLAESHQTEQSAARRTRKSAEP